MNRFIVVYIEFGEQGDGGERRLDEVAFRKHRERRKVPLVAPLSASKAVGVVGC